MKNIKRPATEESRQIDKAIISDPDTWEATDEEFAKAKRGRPKLLAPKEAISIRLDPDILAYFRAKGRNWQTAINDELRAVVEKQRAS